MTDPIDDDTIAGVEHWLRGLQDEICAGLEALDGKARFQEDAWTRAEGGGGRTRVMTEGAVFEQAGVNFSHVQGATLPPAATARRPDLAGRGFRAAAVAQALHRLPYRHGIGLVSAVISQHATCP